jgi:NTP pyrophosphatase (non-canonical NTP hydrolase)
VSSEEWDSPAVLSPPAVEGLTQTQKNFAVYQSQAFPRRQPEFFALELAGECGELANLEKKIWRDPSRSDVLPRLADEAADVFISLMNYCNERNIDLEAAVRSKLHAIELRRVAGKMGRSL